MSLAPVVTFMHPITLSFFLDAIAVLFPLASMYIPPSAVLG